MKLPSPQCRRAAVRLFRHTCQNASMIQLERALASPCFFGAGVIEAEHGQTSVPERQRVGFNWAKANQQCQVPARGPQRRFILVASATTAAAFLELEINAASSTSVHVTSAPLLVRKLQLQALYHVTGRLVSNKHEGHNQTTQGFRECFGKCLPNPHPHEHHAREANPSTKIYCSALKLGLQVEVDSLKF